MIIDMEQKGVKAYDLAANKYRGPATGQLTSIFW
jgi:hypothetical protein